MPQGTQYIFATQPMFVPGAHSVSSGAVELLDCSACRSKSRVAKAHEMLQRLQQQVLVNC